MTSTLNPAATLPNETRRWLLTWARNALAVHLAGEPSAAPGTLPSGAAELRGCFVSLHSIAGDLRGCIGTFEAAEPLWTSVRGMAIAAASRDPRFPPLERDELDGCAIEISVLSPLRPARHDELVVGVHGVCIALGSRRGVLLPQVAVEHRWDRDTLLANVCRKAGLPADAWHHDEARIEVFSAEVFAEES